jgi:hypothetical protein
MRASKKLGAPLATTIKTAPATPEKADDVLGGRLLRPERKLLLPAPTFMIWPVGVSLTVSLSGYRYSKRPQIVAGHD